MDTKKPLFSRSDLIKISLPLIIQQILKNFKRYAVALKVRYNLIIEIIKL